MSEHIPEIEEYVKRLNWYLQEHYPANKKITAEEWNALFLALINQGNAQEDTLAQICNELLPIQVNAINDLIDITTNHESRVTSLESTVANHGQRITGLETLTQNHEQRLDIIEPIVTDHGERIEGLESLTQVHERRLDTLEPIVSDHGERVEDLESLTQVHEQRLDVLEPIVTDHGERVEDLEDLTASHSVLITGLRTDVNSNTNRIASLETETADKPYRIETVLKYNISAIPQGVIYAKDGKKDLLIEFFNETFTVPLSETTSGSRKGSVIAIDKVTDTITNHTTQTEVFYFKEGAATRQVIYNENTGSTITMSDWVVVNNGFFQSLRASITENADEILGIKRDYATKSELDTAKTNLQTQITTNRTDLNTILPDYVKKSDNTNIDYLTQNELSVSDTGALVQTERLKNITTGTTSAPRQTTPIPVVDNKARLFLPQEIASLRDLVDWKASLLGEAINFSVSFSDIPEDPTPAQLQTYLNNKWASIGGTTPIIDQTTMTDESMPLSYRWYVNENKWIYARGDTGTRATNNIYDEHGTLITPGARGTTVGSNLKFHVMYETNGEGAVVGLDALEETVINNSADISELREDLTDYETSNNTEVTNLKTRATNLETRATSLEGLMPTKVDKISNTLNMQAVYGLNSSGVHNLTGVANATTGNTLVLRDADGRAHITAPTANTHIANKSYVDSADSTLQSNLTNEATARANADTALQNNIDAEASARSTADSTLQTNINTEASTRATNDSTLQAAINTEASTRGAADTALENSKVDKSNLTSRVYCTGTTAGEQVMLNYSIPATNYSLVRRTNDGNVQVATTPTDNTHATSKSYVDTGLSPKIEFVEDTTGSSAPSPLADYYNKSTMDEFLSQKANTNLRNITPTRTSASVTINGITGIKYSGAHICIESWISSDGDYGYRIYDDGYCEQWGKKEVNVVGSTQIELFKAFKNVNYLVLLTTNADITGSNKQTASGFHTSYFLISSENTKIIGWKASGYINL